AQPASDVPAGAPAEPAPVPATTTTASAPGTSADPDTAVSSMSSPALPAPSGDEPAPDEPQPHLWTWPIEAVELAEVGQCLAVEGELADQVEALFSQANQLTRYEQAGVAYAVVVRPLLPDEPDCPEGG